MVWDPKDPWGKGDKFDDAFRQAQGQLGQLREFLPSGGLKNIILVILAIFLIWQSAFIVAPDEEGVVKRFGIPVRTVSPGPHLKIPLLESVLQPKVAKLHRVEVGFRKDRQGRQQMIPQEALMLTGDMNILDVSDPHHPKEIGRWGLPVEGKSLHDIWVQDGFVWMSYMMDGLVILDIGGAGKGGTPAKPVLLSRLFYPDGPTHNAFRWGDYLFLGDEDFGTTWTLRIRLDAPGAPAQGDHDLEVEVPHLVHEILEIGRDRTWQFSIHRGSIHVLPA